MHIKDLKSGRDVVTFCTQNITSITVKDLYNTAGFVILFLVFYAGLYLCIGDPFLPGQQGSAWAILIVWLGGHIGAFLAELVNIPAPVGMICTGLFLRNVSNAVLISGLKKSWSKEIRGAALATIFLRSGLELDLRVFKTIGIPAVKLLFVPGLVEAFFDGGIAVALFGMTPLFGFALGFILKAIGPALVIQLMFELQQKRLGTERNLPLTVVAAASFDDMVAITGYTIFINIAVQGSTNQGWHIAQGPLSVVFGGALGLIAAFICGATKLWNNKYKRILSVIIAALSMKYFFDQLHFESGGALAALTLGLTVKEMWRRQWPKLLARQDDEPDENIRQAEGAVRFIWRFLLMPLLFCLIGTTINFSTLASSTIAKACSIVFAGLGLRMVITFFIMRTSRFSWLECTWFAIAWIPKATVQAALGSLPADAVARAYPVGSPKHEQYTQWGQDALTTAVFEIIISGTLGCLLVRWLTPFLLKTQAPEDDVPMQRVKSAALVGREDSVNGEGGRFDKDNLVADHVGRLEQLAAAMIATGNRDEEEEARLYGQRLRAGVRALASRLRYEIDPKDIIGVDAYTEAVRELKRRNRGGAPLGGISTQASGTSSGLRFRNTRGDGDEESNDSIEIVEHVARTA